MEQGILLDMNGRHGVDQVAEALDVILQLTIGETIELFRIQGPRTKHQRMIVRNGKALQEHCDLILLILRDTEPFLKIACAVTKIADPVSGKALPSDPGAKLQDAAPLFIKLDLRLNGVQVLFLHVRQVALIPQHAKACHGETRLQRRDAQGLMIRA